MRKWTVELLKNVNGIEFGTSREMVREKLGNNYVEFKKSKLSVNTTDDYRFCHVYYDRANRMEAIEFFDSIKIVVSGKVVFPNGLKELMGLVDDLIYEDGYYFSEQSSIGVTMDEDKMVSILFGRKDYYN